MRSRRGIYFSVCGASLVSVLAVFLFFAALSNVQAQLAVSMTLSHTGYLLYEDVDAKVYFRNLSGRPLVFGENEKLRGTLSFSIIGPDGKKRKLLNKKLARNLLTGIVLNAGATESVIAPISRMYDLTKPGGYSIYAVITHPLLDSAYKSPETAFSVFNGVRVWQRVLGVPDVLNEKKGEVVKSRLAKILSFYDGRRRLFALMIEDKDLVYGVHRLVQDVEGGLPVCMVDGLSRIHIFAQTGAKIFAYYIYNINGKLEKREIYRKSEGVNPRMIRDPNQGVIRIVGGEMAVEGKDYRDEKKVDPFFKDDLGGKRN